MDPRRSAESHRASRYAEQSPELLKKFTEFLAATGESSIEEPIQDLVAVRAAQLNGCTFCLDMHVKQAKIHGERELPLPSGDVERLHFVRSPRARRIGLDGSPYQLPEHGVPRVRTQLSEEEISDLSFVLMAVNSWNRLNIGFKTLPGSADTEFGLDKAALK